MKISHFGENAAKKMQIIMSRNLQDLPTVLFSSVFSHEYTTANLSASDRDRQRPFSTSSRDLQKYNDAPGRAGALPVRHVRKAGGDFKIVHKLNGGSLGWNGERF